MRSVPAPLADHIQGGALTLATLVLITRTDGVTMGFTDRDADLSYLGQTYHAAEGIGTTAIQSKTGTGVDNMDVSGLITSDRITEDDLDAGRYDGARIEVRLVNRAYAKANPNVASHALLLVGYLGGVEVVDGRFSVTVKSLSDRLKQVIGDTLSPTCRCRCLGDLQCKVVLTGNTLQGVPIRATASVSSVSGPTSFVVNGSAPSGHYTRGTVQFLTGANAGLRRDVKTHGAGGAIALRTAFPFPVAAGDQAVFVAGCDKTFATCDVKFGNANNFHGEQEIPTNDKTSQIGR